MLSPWLGQPMQFDQLKRRDLIALLSGAAAWPLTARAQQATVALVGLLSGGQLDDRLINAVRQGLKEGGYIEGRNIAIKYRSPMVVSTDCQRWPLSWRPTLSPSSLRFSRRRLQWPRKRQLGRFRLFSRSALIRSISVSFPVSIAPAATSRA
jgi:hypothetical protein